MNGGAHIWLYGSAGVALAALVRRSSHGSRGQMAPGTATVPLQVLVRHAADPIVAALLARRLERARTSLAPFVTLRTERLDAADRALDALAVSRRRHLFARLSDL